MRLSRWTTCTVSSVAPATESLIVQPAADDEYLLGACVRLRLVPRQHQTGGKVRPGRIIKRGEVYLRTLLIHAMRAVPARVAEKTGRACS